MSLLWKTCRNPICGNDAEPGQDHCLDCTQRNNSWAGRAEAETQSCVDAIVDFFARWRSGQAHRTRYEFVTRIIVGLIALALWLTAVTLAFNFLSQTADRQAAERGLTVPTYTKEVRH